MAVMAPVGIGTKVSLRLWATGLSWGPQIFASAITVDIATLHQRGAMEHGKRGVAPTTTGSHEPMKDERRGVLVRRLDMLFLVLVCLHHLPVNQIHCSIEKASANSDGPIDCEISIWIVSRLNYRLGLQFIFVEPLLHFWHNMCH
jgi:hypothetical protein